MNRSAGICGNGENCSHENEDVSIEPVFQKVEGWGKSLPDTTAEDISDIAILGEEVYLLYRRLGIIAVCSTDGVPLRTLESGTLDAHGITPAENGSIYVVDRAGNAVLVLSGSGEVLSRIESGPSNPALYDERSEQCPVDRGYPPFTLPTRLAVSQAGDLYVADGYGNARIHQYSAVSHELISSWGEPGSGDGEFRTPHSLCIDRLGRILVCDRDNDRIQLFGPTGQYLGQWPDLQRPQDVVQGPDKLILVAEGAWRAGYAHHLHGQVAPAPSRVTVLREDGSVVSRIGVGAGSPPHSPFLAPFIAAHGIAVDGNGDVYVAEVSATILGRLGHPELRHESVQKYQRVK